MHANDQLRSILRATTVEPEPESELGLPALIEGEYQPYARPATKPIHAVHFISPKGEVRSFQYVHLDSDSRYSAEAIIVRFLGLEAVQVTIRGRNLWRLYDYLHQHRTPWVMEAESDFAPDDQPAITKFEFEKLNLNV